MVNLPVSSGWITAVYGPTGEPLDSGGFNKGLDIGVPVGTPIYAVTGGTVVSTGDHGDGWGTSIKIRDAAGNIHNYGHLSSASVRPGDTIAPGTVIAKSGNTGKSTGPHISYDVLGSGGTYIDPSPFLGFNAAGSNYGYSGISTADITPFATNGRANTGGSVAPNNLITQGDASNWWGGPDVSMSPTSGGNWWDDPADSAPRPYGQDFVTLPDGTFGAFDPNTGAFVPYGNASKPSASTIPAMNLINIGGTYYWSNPYTGEITSTGMTDPPPAFGGYSTFSGPSGIWAFDPATGSKTLIDPSKTSYDWTVNSGHVIGFDPTTGQPTFTPIPTAPDTTPNYITGGANGIWTQDPVSGEFKFLPTPAAPGSRGPAQPKITYVGGAAPSSAASRTSAYDAQKAAIAAQAAEAAKQRAFQEAQNKIDRELALYRDVQGQRFQGGESFADRSQQNAQFTAGFGLDRANTDLARRQLGLQAAAQFGQLISTPDLAALPGFLAAGGGNVIAGLAGGTSALTQNALLPGALTLQQLRQPFEALPEYTYQPQQNPNMPEALPMPQMAGGGYTTEPMFRVGDRADGLPNDTEEIIVNPTGAPIEVLPNPFNKRNLTMPRFAEGTGLPYSTKVGGVAGGAGDDVQPGIGTAVAGPGDNPFGEGWTIIDASEINPSYLPSFGLENYLFAVDKNGAVSKYDRRNGSVSLMFRAPMPGSTRVYDENLGWVWNRDVNTSGPNSTNTAVTRALRAGTHGVFGPGKNVRVMPGGKEIRILDPAVLSPNGRMKSGVDLSRYFEATEAPTRPEMGRLWGTRPERTPRDPSLPSPGTIAEGDAPAPAPTTPAPTDTTGQIDTPAGTVDTGTGGVSQTTPPTPAQQQQQAQQQASNTLDQNMADVEAIRLALRPFADTWNPMAVDYLEGDPNVRASRELAMQTAYGVPVSTLQNNAMKLRLPGVGRSSLALGV